jgi:hypothetical protein
MLLIISLLSKLPSEELGEAIREATQRMNVVDTKSAALEILEAYAQEVSSEVKKNPIFFHVLKKLGIEPRN